MKKLILILLLSFPMQAFAVTLAGVDMPDRASVGANNLLLNGAGIRTRFMFKVYVGALYLGEKRATDEAVLADEKPKRLALHILRHLEAGELMEALRKGLLANLTADEFAPLAARFVQFTKVFRDVGQVNNGDVITIDYLPGVGTVVGVNGKERWRMQGEDFYRGMLKIWLGNKPVQEDLKKELLGG